MGAFEQPVNEPEGWLTTVKRSDYIANLRKTVVFDEFYRETVYRKQTREKSLRETLNTILKYKSP